MSRQTKTNPTIVDQGREQRSHEDDYSAEARQREREAVRRYGQGAYQSEEIRRDEKGRILR